MLNMPGLGEDRGKVGGFGIQSPVIEQVGIVMTRVMMPEEGRLLVEQDLILPGVSY